MQQQLQKWMAASVITLGALANAQAQTVATLDDLVLPGANTDYAATQAPGTDYSFQSGNVKFYGRYEPWSFYNAFNYTNVVDTADGSFMNDKAAITGKGYNNSDNYGVVYLTQDYPANPTQSLLIGAKLQGAAVGNKVAGTYLTNTTYAYQYMLDNFTAGDSMSVVVRGYLNNVKTADSVVFNLAKYTTTDTLLVRDWQWVNLLPLGNIDSFNLQIVATDPIAPYYIAFDDFTTLDGACPEAIGLAATTVNENSATITWSDAYPGSASIITTYEVAVDQTAALVPTGQATTSATHSYAAANLLSNTTYYAHIRTTCPNGGFSAWDTASFKTLQGTGIAGASKNNLQVSISPNPAQDYIQLQVPEAVTANIYSLEGKLLKTISNARQIDISGLSAGTYVVRVVATADYSRSATLRFIKNH